jgi:cold shock CspA family protein
MESKQSAIVLFFDKGWGFAELEADRTGVYLHYTEIIGRKILHEGDKILCFVEPSGHPKNPFKATQIELVLVPKAEVRS